ncbi:metallo-beta-lactamase domain containing protein [Entamoeba histolytica HM-1:IMSS-B]|uniref:ribonuclease Z n=6 Tax=Entamoeba histolytica TaxID=5759 RepID=C4M2A3_ENTH1|nr:metallo-beta-lactamase domain-containing protein [Entamoeba histolytica HM-1:IMSS]EMD45260.1 metallobeta-lactamase domain containing protein [Entamoeba histolytica KU27]EMH77435.1 metallo-beta-lactamase domain containing protein [Entamoeba histolytica HM-1:IMSS-B]ENY64703.1 metallo-beta-lactamase domain containing protein [Entamoeba histolytica HM-1:IMSS-A]GAT95401.1 metallo-beta-lactamase domain-containing protein [Entamoeba histolytica]EAL49865.2 metallo-beta-lactamase domain-containing p|eukprot:XP_655252.2 metallo-beta-lactamase domain-containing protein [Entamoeba histolytica HM-1:IMSS]
MISFNAIMKSTPITLTILGNGESEIGSSFILALEKNRYIFNIPEGVQRCCMEYKLKLPRMTKILFTSSDWSCWGGYPGALMTYYSTELVQSPLHFPSDLFEQMDCSHFLPPTSLIYKDIPGFTSDSTPFTDDYLSFIPIVTECNSIKTINYHILLPTFFGKFDGVKANELKIPGPLRAKLAIGESIKLGNGNVVNPSDVCGQPSSPGYLIVLHFPTTDHVNEYLKKELVNKVCCIVAIINDAVKDYQPFKDFIAKHSTSLVLFLKDRISSSANEIIKNVQYTSFRMTSELHKSISSILPQNAPSFIRAKTVPLIMPTNNCKYFEDTPSLIQYTIYPKIKYTLIKREQTFIIPQNQPLYSPLGNKFQVILFGTGGAVPGKARNVSGEIIRFNKTTIMIDCGECIAYQVVNSGIHPDDINILYVTHNHGDHIFGIMSLLKMRTKPLTIIGPRSMEKGFNLLCQHYHIKINFINNNIFSDDCVDRNKESIIQNIETKIGARIITVKLNHQAENYGIRFEINGTSVVFTGDTLPCLNDKKLCMNADYVIHECNFEDGMEGEAINRTHSTPSQIEAMLKDCNNKVIILNHIGQRTSKFADIMKKEYLIPMIYSFDGMVFDDTLSTNWKQYKEYLLSFFSLNEIDEEND